MLNKNAENDNVTNLKVKNNYSIKALSLLTFAFLVRYREFCGVTLLGW